MYTEFYSISHHNRDQMNTVNERIAELHKAEARDLEIIRERVEYHLYITITYTLDEPAKLPPMPRQSPNVW